MIKNLPEVLKKKIRFETKFLSHFFEQSLESRKESIAQDDFFNNPELLKEKLQKMYEVLTICEQYEQFITTFEKEINTRQISNHKRIKEIQTKLHTNKDELKGIYYKDSFWAKEKSLSKAYKYIEALRSEKKEFDNYLKEQGLLEQTDLNSTKESLSDHADIQSQMDTSTSGGLAEHEITKVSSSDYTTTPQRKDLTSTSWSKDDTTSTSWSKDDTTSTSWSKDDTTSTSKSRKRRKYKVNEMFKKVVSRLKSDGNSQYSRNADSSKEHSFASFKSLRGFWNVLTNRKNRNGEVRNEDTSGIGEVGRGMFEQYDQSDFSEERDQPHDELRKLAIDILENHLLERGFGELAAKEQWQFDVKGINKGEFHVFSKDMANKDTIYYITYRDKEKVLNTTYKECEVNEALLQILKDQISKVGKAGKVVRGSSGSLSLALGPIHLELPRVSVMRMQEDNESPQLFFTDNNGFFDPNNPLSANMRGYGWKYILPEKLITSSLTDKFQNDIDGWISTIVKEHCPNLEEPEQEKFVRDMKKYLNDEKVFPDQNKSERYYKMVERLIVSRAKTKNEETKKAKENMAEQTQANNTTYEPEKHKAEENVELN